MNIADFEPGLCYYSVYTYSLYCDKSKIGKIVESYGIYMCLSNENGVVEWLNADGSDKAITKSDYVYLKGAALDHIRKL